jgi:hypothetical protein
VELTWQRTLGLGLAIVWLSGSPSGGEEAPVVQPRTTTGVVAETTVERAVTQKADLETDKSLDNPLAIDPEVLENAVDPPEPTRWRPNALRCLVEGVQDATGHGLVVVGTIRMRPSALRAMDGRSARSAMQAIATAAGKDWEWHTWQDFYLLWPPDMPRHDAKPRSMVKKFAALGRKIPAAIASDSLIGGVQQLGRGCSVPMIVSLVGADARFADRSSLSCVIAGRDRSLDEAMQALTATTGSPWFQLQDACLFAFQGRPLTPEERRTEFRTVAGRKFALSLTFAQVSQMQTQEGLEARFLDPQQRRWIDTAMSEPFASQKIRAEMLNLRLSGPSVELRRGSETIGLMTVR